jgi:hypothetical protein
MTARDDRRVMMEDVSHDNKGGVGFQWVCLDKQTCLGSVDTVLGATGTTGGGDHGD